MHKEKLHKGSIENWFKLPCSKDKGLGYYIVGDFLNHPDFGNKTTNTSWVEKHDVDSGEIETRNSRYTLIGKEINI